MNWFSHVIVDSGISRGRKRTTMAAKMESRNMAAIQIIGWPRHAVLVYRVLPCTFLIYEIMLCSMDTCHIKLYADQYHMTILIWSQAHVRLTCWKQSQVVQKTVNYNTDLKVNQIITVSSLQMFFVYTFCFVYRSFVIIKLKIESQTIYRKPHRKAPKLKSKFNIVLV